MSFDLAMERVMPSRRRRSPDVVPTASTQRDLFEIPVFDTTSALIDAAGQPRLILIGCGESKQKRAAPARSLYVSERFKLAASIAETLHARFFILSGKHGLLPPDKVIEPYNVDLRTLANSQRKKWAGRICSALARLSELKSVCILAEDAYAEPVASTLKVAMPRLDVRTPLSGLDDRLRSAWHSQALHTARRIVDLKKLYSLIEKARSSEQSFLLRDLRERELPARGVYVFVDRKEKNFEGSLGRIVRIGTHAISEGSKSQLRTRLRSHLGQVDGSGNHRGSIFRLHVGRAMLKRDHNLPRLTTWGVGQDAPKKTRRFELEHERRVSDYLNKLEVVILPVSDEASKHSMRAVIETQLIALLSDALQPIDRPSKRWLGTSSPSTAIACSGLWNLRDVGVRYEPDSAGSVSELVTLVDWSQ